MKSLFLAVFAVLTLSSAFASTAPRVNPCEVAVGIIPRTGLIYRTTANALEASALEEKGLTVCQDDDGSQYVDPFYQTVVTDSQPTAKCKNAEFKIELLYRESKLTRFITIYRAGSPIYTEDFDGNRMSQKIFKTIPTCEELRKLPVLK